MLFYNIENKETLNTTKNVLENADVWARIKEYVVIPHENDQRDYCQEISEVYSSYSSLESIVYSSNNIVTTQYIRSHKLDGLSNEGERICLCRASSCSASQIQPTQFNFSNTMARLGDPAALIRDSKFFGGLRYQEDRKFTLFCRALNNLFRLDQRNGEQVDGMVEEYFYDRHFNHDSYFYDTDRTEGIRPEAESFVNNVLNERLAPQFRSLSYDELEQLWDYLKAGHETLEAASSSEAFQIGQFYFEPYLAAQSGGLDNYHMVHTYLMDTGFLSIMTNLVERPLIPAMNIIAALY